MINMSDELIKLEANLQRLYDVSNALGPLVAEVTGTEPYNAGDKTPSEQDAKGGLVNRLAFITMRQATIIEQLAGRFYQLENAILAQTPSVVGSRG